MTTGLEGRRALVTGSSGGIGSAIAALFAASGARVLGLDVVESGRTETILCDLGDAEAVERAADQALAALGQIDILVNCAGVSYPETVCDLTRDAYHRTLQVNLHAPVFLMKRAGVVMKEQHYGRIVNVTSIHARLSEPLSLAYDVSKGGLEAATRTVAIELAPHGVLANAIAPGFVSTPMSVVDGVNELESDWFQTIYVENARLPIERPAMPPEVASVAAFLCSEGNTYLTGQSILVDGGLSARF